MATYAVGDLQGCLDPLRKLLEEVRFDPATDRLWLTGDLVNRGPQSLDTLRFVKSLGEAAIVVLGNHDLHLLAYANGQRKPSASDTLSTILLAPDCNELIDWLLKKPLMHYDAEKDIAMVHAGIPPIWSIRKALKRAAEVEECLQNDQKNILFFKKMYGNFPDEWCKSLKGMERLRVITNYFTRMRYCTAEGQLELDSKFEPPKGPAGFAPWYSFPNPKLNKTRIIFGHWAALMGKTRRKQFIALDTGYIWGGHLTMMRLEDHRVYEMHAQ